MVLLLFCVIWVWLVSCVLRCFAALLCTTDYKRLATQDHSTARITFTRDRIVSPLDLAVQRYVMFIYERTSTAFTGPYCLCTQSVPRIILCNEMKAGAVRQEQISSHVLFFLSNSKHRQRNRTGRRLCLAWHGMIWHDMARTLAAITTAAAPRVLVRQYLRLGPSHQTFGC